MFHATFSVLSQCMKYTMKYFFSAFFVLFASAMSFSQSSSVVGDAVDLGNNCYRITENILWQSGAVWFNDPLNLEEDFEITLSMNFGNNDGGADGMVFVMQDIGLNAEGEDGGGMGYDGFGGNGPSVGIEIDTFQNNDQGDPAFDHMALSLNGYTNHNGPFNYAGPVSADFTAQNIEDGQDHTFTLTWDRSENELNVFFDCAPRLSANIDLVADIFDDDPFIWWGFTAATGGLSNEHKVCISEYALGLDDSQEVCLGDEVQLGVVGSEGGTYQWSPTDFLDNPNIANPICTPDNDIDYTVTFTDVCGEQTQLETTVDVINVELDVPEEVIFCDDEPAPLTIDNPEGLELLWDGEPFTPDLELTDGAHVLTAQLGECSNEFDVMVDVQVAPVIDWEEIIGFCDGGEQLIDATFPGATYSWQDASDTPTYLANQTETVTLNITSDSGCERTYIAEVTEFPNPEPQLPENVVICDGEELVLSPVEGNVVAWSDQSQGQTLTVTAAGTYTVEVESNEGCPGEDETTVQVFAAPNLGALNDQEICEGTEYELVVPQDPSLLYLLNGDELPEEGIALTEDGFYLLNVLDPTSNCQASESFELNVTDKPELENQEDLLLCEGDIYEIPIVRSESHTYYLNGEENLELAINAPGIYEVIEENQCGVDSMSFEAFGAVCNCDWYIPNTFTPNGDFINEQLFFTAECNFRVFEWIIVNRWGDVVFRTEDPNEPWDGSDNGGEYFVPDGVYHWQVRGEVQLPKEVVGIEDSGHITVVR